MIELQKFDTKNTATIDRLICTKKQAIETAIRRSMQYVKVILRIGKKWNEYEKGEKTAWSYPDGIE